MSPLVAVAIAAVSIGLTILRARRGIGDRHTVEAHHRALDAMAEIAADRHAYRSGTPLVQPQPAPSPLPRRHTPAHRRRAVPTTTLRWVGAAAIAGLALAVGLAVVVIARQPSGSAGHPVPSRSARGAAPAPLPATAAGQPARTPPTTGPAAVMFDSGDSQEARFRVLQAGAKIELVAVSACWVQIRTGSATGPTVFTGTLARGDRRPLPTGQPIWVRMGNPPGISIEVNGAALAFPPPAGSQPFNLVFKPTA